MNFMRKGTVLAALAGGMVLAGSGVAAADAGAQGAAVGSPGVLSGNLVQVPVHVPVNVCGNTINVIGLLNPTFGNSCTNADVHPAAATDDRDHAGHWSTPAHFGRDKDCK